MSTTPEPEGGLVSLRFGEYFGIELRLHWTFLALGAWMGLTVLSQTGSLLIAAHWVITLGSIFACVALHEYGHALAARHYGIGTQEITLLPIGGIARLERLPEDPKQELWIALAGPATNYVLAAILLFLYLLAGGSVGGLFSFGLMDGSLLATLIQVNLIMGLFNLLPALPMDGGRVLRALLSLRMPALKATGIATSIARMLAAGLVVYGLVRGGIMMAIIGGFVWFTARSEYQNAVLLERAKANRHRREPGFGFPDAHDPRGQGRPPSGEWIQPEVTKPGGKGFGLHEKNNKSY